jgi:membrane-associated phospholipid phosphatase
MDRIRPALPERISRASLPGLGSVDLVLIAVLLFLTLLTAVFHSRVPNPPAVIVMNIGAAVLFLGLNRLQRGVTRPAARFFLRLFSVSVPLIVIYETTVRLTFILWPAWQDPGVISLERALFKIPPTVAFQAVFSPALTEWMMFSYLAYFILYPVVGATFFFRRGEAVWEEFLFILCFNNIFCNLLYLVYPVDNPIAGLGPAHTVPLKGFVFTVAGEYVRTHVNTPGGGMPSGHVAATAIMLFFAYRHDRRSFYLFLPVAVSVILSTVYCRFHYLTDAVMGIVAACFCWWAAPVVKRALDRALGLRAQSALP